MGIKKILNTLIFNSFITLIEYKDLLKVFYFK